MQSVHRTSRAACTKPGVGGQAGLLLKKVWDGNSEALGCRSQILLIETKIITMRVFSKKDNAIDSLAISGLLLQDP